MMYVLKVLQLYFNYKAHAMDERRMFYVTLTNTISNYLLEGSL